MKIELDLARTGGNRKASRRMKVFVLTQTVEDETMVYGVYLTKAAARADIKAFEDESKEEGFPFATPDDWEISEEEVKS